MKDAGFVLTKKNKYTLKSLASKKMLKNIRIKRMIKVAVNFGQLLKKHQIKRKEEKR